MNKAVRILERILCLRIPVFLSYKSFHEKMRILLSNYKSWLEIWDGISENIKKLFELIQNSNQFKKFNRQFNILKLIISSFTIIGVVFAFYNMFALLSTPLIVTLLPLIYYLRDILAERYLVKPNRKSVEYLLKSKRSDIAKLIIFLKSL
ncbi:MAG: hypothetical protein OdinLCB4_003180 [Candidatus Odinarchaeum yellowstonii]|uniref:Uncharacterized protein n=1 Tax=Odinarchaeota yellowstonii (strain LCB_4) TaxID=1841599 RepID=A0AAF0D3R8_ODILC|nr:MAG: hypothetical protein OdinLCB4_003180 [Candidatus Odinarchaeum yellowstonii]